MFTSITATSHDEVLQSARGFLLHDTFVIEVRRGRDAPVRRHALHHVIAWTPQPTAPQPDDADHMASSVARVAQALREYAQHDMALLVHDTADGATGPAIAQAVAGWQAHDTKETLRDPSDDGFARALAAALTAPARPKHTTGFVTDRAHDAAMTLGSHLRARQGATGWWARLWTRLRGGRA
jgi:hypothetical protein